MESIINDYRASLIHSSSLCHNILYFPSSLSVPLWGKLKKYTLSWRGGILILTSFNIAKSPADPCLFLHLAPDECGNFQFIIFRELLRFAAQRNAAGLNFFLDDHPRFQLF